MSRTTRNGRAQRHRFYGEFQPVGAPHDNYWQARARTHQCNREGGGTHERGSSIRSDGLNDPELNALMPRASRAWVFSAHRSSRRRVPDCLWRRGAYALCDVACRGGYSCRSVPSEGEAVAGRGEVQLTNQKSDGP